MKRLAVPLLLVMMVILISACGASSPSANSSSAATSSSATNSAESASATINATPTTDPASQPMGSTTNASIAATGTSEFTVFAAASLTEAFTEIGQQFDAANNSQTIFNFAGSQQLAQQIGQGAPADVFASANRTQLENVIKSGQVISGTQQVFVRNRLVVVYPQDNPAQLTDLGDLAKPGIKLVLAAKEVPVGQYSLDFLAKASELPQFTGTFSDTVLANVVSYEENVRAVLSKVALGEADAGIVYSSDITRDSADKIGRIDIPDELNTIANYPIAPIKDAPNTELAQKFIDYVLSSSGQQILVDYGFISITE